MVVLFADDLLLVRVAAAALALCYHTYIWTSTNPSVYIYDKSSSMPSSTWLSIRRPTRCPRWSARGKHMQTTLTWFFFCTWYFFSRLDSPDGDERRVGRGLAGDGARFTEEPPDFAVRPQKKFLTSNVWKWLIFQRRFEWDPSVSIPNICRGHCHNRRRNLLAKILSSVAPPQLVNRQLSDRYWVLRAHLSIH